MTTIERSAVQRKDALRVLAQPDEFGRSPWTQEQADAFWRTFNRQRMKHGYYEATWAALSAAVAEGLK